MRVARNDPNFRDDGRREITGRDSDAFKFRVLTLRQLKDARFFFHNGSFTSVKDVVQYFNAGVPQDAEAAAAGTLTTPVHAPARTRLASRPGPERRSSGRSHRLPRERPLRSRVRALRSRLTDEDVPAEPAGLPLLGLPSGSRGAGRR